MGNLTSNLRISTILAPHHSSTFLQDIVGIVEPEPSFQLFFSNQRYITEVSTLPSSPWCQELFFRHGMLNFLTAKNWTPIIMLALSEAAAQVLPYQAVEIQDSKGTGFHGDGFPSKQRTYLVPVATFEHDFFPFQICFKSCFSLTHHSPWANVC